MPEQRKVRWRRRSAIVWIASLGIIIGWYSALYGVEQVVSTIGALQQGIRRGDTELLFLQAALDRLAADAKQMHSESHALPSLRAEPAAVTHSIRATGRAPAAATASGP